MRRCGRLCPADEELTEACFQRNPLEFVQEQQSLRWKNGTVRKINGTFVNTGTSPPGSTWSRNPIPRIDFNNRGSGQPAGFRGCDTPHSPGCRQFDPPCPEDNGWFVNNGSVGRNNADFAGECSGDWIGGEIVDQVVIPSTLKPGAYVLGWRW